MSIACEVKLKRPRTYKSASARGRHAHQDVLDWNATHDTGAPVCAHRDNGEILLTKTRSAAQVLVDTAVVWVDGISGAYALFRIHDPGTK